MMRILLVDDEKLARERMKTLLSETDIPHTIVGEAENGKEALMLIPERQPDVVFLDIQMPVLDGFDVVSLLPEPRPAILFITAYDEYAIRAFEVNAVDYLMKPVRKERLDKAMRRIQNTPKTNLTELLKTRAPNPLIKVPVRYQNEILLLNLQDIFWIEAQGPVIYIHTERQKYTCDFILEQLEARLPKNEFFRIHRSLLVSVSKIQKLIPWFNNAYRVELQNGKQLDVARRRLPELKRLIGL